MDKGRGGGRVDRAREIGRESVRRERTAPSPSTASRLSSSSGWVEGLWGGGGARTEGGGVVER